jgi:hypothetical protein
MSKTSGEMRKVDQAMREHVVDYDPDPNFVRNLSVQSVEKARTDTVRSEGVASKPVIVTPAPKQM